MRDYPDTWYAATRSDDRRWPRLHGTHAAEVCVVGGGLAGVTTALELARRGRDVILLEAERIGFGASGRNGGFVSPGFARGMTSVMAEIGEDAGRALYALSVEGADYVRKRIAELDGSLKMGDGWIVARRYRDDDGLRHDRDVMAGLGETVELWDTARVRSVLKSRRYFGALHVPAAFHIHPLNYLRRLASAAEAAGGRLCEDSVAHSIAERRGGFAVTTSHGLVQASHVVLATSAYGRGLNGTIERAVLPVATYIGVTSAIGERIPEAIATTAAISDTRRAGDYYRVLAGERILWGGRITTRQSEPGRLAAKMRSDMLSVYPQLGLPAMDYAWGGLMGYALHKMPIIGELAPGLWVATAFGGHGLNTTAMAGLLIARAIAGENDAVRRFAPFGPRWAGGPLGRAGVQLSYWAMQARDRMDEAKARRRSRAGAAP